ncbi:hypothetical protein DSUL_170055 [Desulfovibrionales bacterium]
MATLADMQPFKIVIGYDMSVGRIVVFSLAVYFCPAFYI